MKHLPLFPVAALTLAAPMMAIAQNIPAPILPPDAPAPGTPPAAPASGAQPAAPAPKAPSARGVLTPGTIREDDADGPAKVLPGAASTNELTPVLVSPVSALGEPDYNFLLLTKLPAGNAEIVAFARKNYANVTTLADPGLRQLVRFTLAKLEDNPGESRTILREHLDLLSNYFFSVARETMQRNDAKGTFNALEISLRCNEANLRTRLLMAEILERSKKETETLDVLREGFKYINFKKLDEDVHPAYVNTFLQALDTLLRDQEILRFADAWARHDADLNPPLRAVLRGHAARAAFRLGDYPKTLEILRLSPDGSAQNILLESQALFLAGDTRAAIALLNKNIALHKGRDLDSLLTQLTRFYGELNYVDHALTVIKWRLKNNPSDTQARVQALYLLDTAGRQDELIKESREILAARTTTLPTLLALATFAAARGYPAIAESCYTRAGTQRGAFLDRQSATSRDIFATVLVESLIRAKRPADAIAAYNRLQAERDLHAGDPQGVIYALLGVAYHARGDLSTAQRYFEQFRNDDTAQKNTLKRIANLEKERDALTDGEERQLLDERILLLIRQSRNVTPRDISPETAIAVARLQRLVGANHAALDLLETNLAKNPRNPRLKADYIITRIRTGTVAAQPGRKTLAAETAELLDLRRPDPRVWTEIKTWLDSANPATAGTDSNLPALRSRVASLVRNDILTPPELRP